MTQPPRTTLTPSALRDLVCEVAADRARWLPRMRFEHQRVSERLVADPSVEVWVISWMPGHDTGFHDHGVSAGAFCVAEGELVEELLVIGYGARARRLLAGRAVGFGPDHLHRVHNASAAPAVSVHAYSPPLAGMGAYAVGRDGSLRRAPHPADAELRPLAAAG